MAYRLLDGAMGGMSGQVADAGCASEVLSPAIGKRSRSRSRTSLLAYSTISHIGFLLLGFVNGIDQWLRRGEMFYTISYALMAAAADASLSCWRKKPA